MSEDTKPKRTRSRKSTSELEAKISELEAKLASLSSQIRPSEEKPTAPPRPQPSKQEAPKPRPAPSGPTHGTLPAGMAPPKPKFAETLSEVSAGTEPAGEVAPAYATISSSGYTGNRYFATRARLAYHPPTKQFKGESVTVAVAPEPPKPKRGTMPAGWKP